METSYIIGSEKKIVITPKNESHTVTVNLGEIYHKIRNVIVTTEEELKRIRATFDPNEWYKFNTGSSAVLISKIQINAALKNMKSSEAILFQKIFWKEQGEEAPVLSITVNQSAQPQPSVVPELVAGVSPSISSHISQVVANGIKMTEVDRIEILKDLKNKLFKITCIMDPEKNFHVVAIKKISEGTFKIVSEIRLLWSSIANSCKFGSKAVRAKGRPGIKQEKLIKEESISLQLLNAGVKYILAIKLTPRATNDKIGLMMESCQGGPLNEYTEDHFDVQKKILPRHGLEHLRFMCQVGKAIDGMHKLGGMIHGDLKGPNVLVVLPQGKPPEIRVSDFGNTIPLGKVSNIIFGTYPPPEVKEELARQKHNASITPPKGISCGQEIDAWAYGVLLYEIMVDSGGSLSFNLGWDRDPMVVMNSLEKIHKRLDINNPIHQIIAKLLDKNPSARITLETAVNELQKIFSNYVTVRDYIATHLDTDEQQKERLGLMCQIVKSVMNLHSTNVFLGDLSDEWMFVEGQTKTPKIVFSIDGSSPQTIKDPIKKIVPGTFNPPEVLVELQQQKKDEYAKPLFQNWLQKLKIWKIRQEARPAIDLSSVQKIYNETLEKIEQEVLSYIPGVNQNSKIDAWALGVLLFKTMFNRPDLVANLQSSTPAVVESALSNIYSEMQGKGTIEQVIKGLLDKNPNSRMILGDALLQLDKELSQI